ncbi:tetratricopeptide repeat protein, partial [Escherichia coli]|nr:tetratricopeptide repeat protein [Escherichia coli]
MAESKTAFSLPAIEKSAEGGNAASQYQLGVKYENGEGVEQDAQKALEWYIKAAEQGHAEAQLNLALMYDMSDYIDRDAEKAVYWYN